MERNPAHGQGDNRLQLSHTVFQLPVPFTVHIRVVRREQSVFDYGFRIILHNRRQAQVPHAAEAGAHFMGVNVVFPGIHIGLFKGGTEALVVVPHLLEVFLFFRDVLDNGVDDRLISAPADDTQAAAEADPLHTAALGLIGAPGLTGFLHAGLNSLVDGLFVNLPVFRRERFPEISKQDILLCHVHAGFLDVLGVYPQHIHLALFIGENGGGANVVVEDQGFQGIRIPEAFRFHRLDQQQGGLRGFNIMRQQQHHEIFLGNRLGIQVTLYVIAADALEEVGLFDGFHAFRQRRGVQPFGHLNHRVDDHAAAAAQAFPSQEAQVQLQEIHRQVLEDTQGRIPAAKVIHLHQVTLFVELLHSIGYQVKTTNGGRLCNFRTEIMHGYVVPSADRFNLIHIVVAEKVMTGDVEGNGQHIIRAAVMETADFLKRKQISPMDESVILHNRDEIVRELFPEFRMPPAHESFRSDQTAR